MWVGNVHLQRQHNQKQQHEGAWGIALGYSYEEDSTKSVKQYCTELEQVLVTFGYSAPLLLSTNDTLKVYNLNIAHHHHSFFDHFGKHFKARRLGLFWAKGLAACFLLMKATGTDRFHCLLVYVLHTEAEPVAAFMVPEIEEWHKYLHRRLRLIIWISILPSNCRRDFLVVTTPMELAERWPLVRWRAIYASCHSDSPRGSLSVYVLPLT